MRKKSLFFLLTILGVNGIQYADAHSHDRVYLVETAPAPVYVVQTPPAPVYVVPTAPAPVVNVIEVESEPPADIVEQVALCPGSSSDYAWINGRWTWNGRWEWTKGYWVQKPHVAAVWMPGHWRKSHHDHRWVWEEGSWR